MLDAASVLSDRVSAAIEAAFGLAGEDPVLRPSQFADTQANAALALAKRIGKNPRDAAAAINDHLDLSDVGTVEVSGPGFLNITVGPEWISGQIAALLADDRLGVPLQERRTIPVDYSAPNVAKEMHVGHLRTTIVGDALVRTLEALGHHVIRQNHIGDWGTPFGMLIEHYLEVGADSAEAALLATDPNAFYQAARAKFDGADDGGAWAVRARERVVQLQAKEPATIEIWHAMIERSKDYFHRIYDALDVTLTDADLAGESTYDPMLADVCTELEDLGLAVVSEGALCVFPEGFTGREGTPLPLIVRKSDGGYGYATTDLATIRHRARTLGADEILYVVGASQALHFRMIFATARAAGWLTREDGTEVVPVHVQIGSVLGEDGKILRTRSGAPLRLSWLLEEAVEKAGAAVAESRPDLSADERADIARQVGIGAVKYADLSVAHDTDYIFDLDRMLALTGSTGPYLQYATARIRSIFRKAGVEPATARETVAVVEPTERTLALALLRYGATVAEVGDARVPHRLAGYLFELAQAFTSFYDACPVLTAPDAATRSSRLALTAATLAVLEHGLDLLGMRSPEQM
ncbi:arginine--tRNA ligase [Litorihabitans aurantiacus]|uniref:Arginine--tRNA ligase n=1 Tax=Litorihabitans aurantiacus TaxID=1930061 RepID=A0AA37XG85_9MICO|nr:arginine--tRNA ligase [Litorihabitans aurantiacus]GMA32569.1 arginine--tRNA ligase [Litorihabitans aurantiacus]